MMSLQLSMGFRLRLRDTGLLLLFLMLAGLFTCCLGLSNFQPGVFRMGQKRSAFRASEAGLEPECQVELVESIPENLTFSPGAVRHSSTFEAWRTLLENAEKSIYLSAFYWTLLSKDTLTTTNSSAQVGNKEWEGRGENSQERKGAGKLG
ncbi:unnamed protein product [Protopolystoma xenopodis]|uniref:Uncharacterized protein n=1 Tax=Protopolystoma xenopodis TaxID=117903 RepID=A0A3S5FDW1_9PLAT|nr:unnamed protein product [Protopolystoma xenopodis]